MELDSKQLGRIRRVANPRDVWTSESLDLTPWLAENIDVLADVLGLTLEVVGTEVPTGDFRVDIHARDGDGRSVVIENQLERSDHGHLGQCIVYASELKASTVVWVSPKFRDDHRGAIDWLNQRTDLNVHFFAVELSVVQIGESGPRAPVFEVVARPNDWQQIVAAANINRPGDAKETSALNVMKQEFFAEVLLAVNEQRPNIRQPAPTTGSWLQFASGPFGHWAIAVPGDQRLRVEAYIDTGFAETNKQLFDELESTQAQLNSQVGETLIWESLETRRASRVCLYRNLNWDDSESRTAAKKWAATSLVKMYDAMNDTLRARAKDLKQMYALSSGTQVAAKHQDS
jgi:hypothetical protein